MRCMCDSPRGQHRKRRCGTGNSPDVFPDSAGLPRRSPPFPSTADRFPLANHHTSESDLVDTLLQLQQPIPAIFCLLSLKILLPTLSSTSDVYINAASSCLVRHSHE